MNQSVSHSSSGHANDGMGLKGLIGILETQIIHHLKIMP